MAAKMADKIQKYAYFTFYTSYFYDFGVHKWVFEVRNSKKIILNFVTFHIFKMAAKMADKIQKYAYLALHFLPPSWPQSWKFESAKFISISVESFTLKTYF